MTETFARTPMWRRFVWIGYWVAAFVATHLPPSSRALQMASGLPDWLLHSVGYAGLGCLAVWAPATRPSGKRLAAWLAVLLLYGALDEISQPLIGRSCQLSDWIADAIGAILGLLAMTAWRQRREQSSRA